MPSSISSEQAKALAEGFFNDIGESKDGLQPKNSLAALYRVAGTLVDEAVNNLNKSDRVATGALSSSLKVRDPRVVNGVNVIVDVEALFYYKFIDKGVKGTNGGIGEYSFKYDMPGKKMTNAIRKWIKSEGVKAKTTKKYKAISKREAKRKKITDKTASMAFAIARKIKQKGLKRTNFFSEALKTTKVIAKQELTKGFRIDIINSLPKKL